MYQSHLITDVIDESNNNARLNMRKTNIFNMIKDTEIPTKNIFEMYLSILKSSDNAYVVELTDSEMAKYRYRPKLLSNDLYGTIDLWHLLLLMNNMVSVTDFTNNKITILRPERLDILERIINNEKDKLK